ncbi:MAG: ABC transporter permease [Mesonia hippocampi]|uniref:ABC transporter permease n=1 Tax=Mesonia hippocampi TaxID=1628250 RepID=UPI003F9C828C
MKFALYIAKRYLFTKSKNNAINIITRIAGIGVFAGALALFIVLSGFSGLKEFSLSFSNRYDPDLSITPKTGKWFVVDSLQLKKINSLEGVSVSSRIIEERVLLSFKKKQMLAHIKGIDTHFLQVNPLDSAIIRGTWLTQGFNQAVIGNDISRQLSLGVLDYSALLKIQVPKPGKGQITDPTKAFNSTYTTVIGVYNISDDLNGKYVFTSYKQAKELLNYPKNSTNSLAIKFDTTANEEDIKKQLLEILGNNVIIRNKIEQNSQLYKMLNTENLAVYFIFTIVLIIALFNLGGAIVMAILDKQKNIKTLYYLGTQRQTLKNIFWLQGILLTFFGGIFGLGAGIIIVLLQQQFSIVMITPTMAYPISLLWENVLVVFITIMLLGVIASYIGATRVSKVLER